MTNILEDSSSSRGESLPWASRETFLISKRYAQVLKYILRRVSKNRRLLRFLDSVAGRMFLKILLNSYKNTCKPVSTVSNFNFACSLNNQ